MSARSYIRCCTRSPSLNTHVSIWMGVQFTSFSALGTCHRGPSHVLSTAANMSPGGPSAALRAHIRYTRVLTRSLRVSSPGKYDIGAHPGPGGQMMALSQLGASYANLPFLIHGQLSVRSIFNGGTQSDQSQQSSPVIRHGPIACGSSAASTTVCIRYANTHRTTSAVVAPHFFHTAQGLNCNRGTCVPFRPP